MTFNISQATLTSVFIITEQDADIVIDIINYLIDKGERSENNMPEPPKKSNNTRDVLWDYI
ncbi:hypothetical protein [Butyrivibrio virus Arian]|nr:hypothetical protein [Butyrivibrio virus Arian]